jgi:hypothetical protein
VAKENSNSFRCSKLKFILVCFWTKMSSHILNGVLVDLFCFLRSCINMFHRFTRLQVLSASFNPFASVDFTRVSTCCDCGEDSEEEYEWKWQIQVYSIHSTIVIKKRSKTNGQVVRVQVVYVWHRDNKQWSTDRRWWSWKSLRHDGIELACMSVGRWSH